MGRSNSTKVTKLSHHNIAEILLKLGLNTNQSINQSTKSSSHLSLSINVIMYFLKTIQSQIWLNSWGDNTTHISSRHRSIYLDSIKSEKLPGGDTSYISSKSSIFPIYMYIVFGEYQVKISDWSVVSVSYLKYTSDVGILPFNIWIVLSKRWLQCFVCILS